MCVFLQQIAECKNKSPAVSPLLYLPVIHQNIVTVLFTCVLVYISSLSEHYQSMAARTLCEFFLIL